MRCQEIQRQVSKRLWSKEEDQLLLEVVQQQPELKWAAIADAFNRQRATHTPLATLSRTNKQCRQRWQNHLNPTLQNDIPWSTSQHNLLFQLFKQHSHQWCVIGSKLQEGGFPRRGDNNIKNYFYSAIKRALKKLNVHIRDHNRDIKKRKSQLYHYSQKYAYKKRLSLERQILGLGRGQTVDPAEAEELVDMGEGEESRAKVGEETEGEELRIVKELQQQMVNKILMIAEWKSDKKFQVSNRDYHDEATSLRDALIDFVQDDNTLTPTQAVELARSMLQISRKCKRRNNKTAHQDYSASIEIDNPQPRPTHPSPTPSKTNSLPLLPIVAHPEEFDGQRIVERFMMEQPVAKKEEGTRDEAIHFLLNPEFPKMNTLNLDQSSEYLNNSGVFSQRYGVMSGLGFGFQPMGLNCDPRNNLMGSLNFGEMLQSRDCRQQAIKEQACSNMAQFNFLSSLRQVKPKQTLMESQAFDFDNNMGVFGGFTGFGMGRVQPEGEERPFFSSQHYLFNRESSHRSNNSKKTKKDGEILENADLLGSQQLLHRSWAYSQNRPEGRAWMSNSNNYEPHKEEYPLHFRGSSFHPFERN